MKAMKQLGKAVIVGILSWQLRRLLAKRDVKIIGVVGSYGKTSAKFAVATILKQRFRVCFQAGNYNDILTVPLVFFNRQTPSLLNPVAWSMIFLHNEQAIRRPYPFDVAVLELGTDGPGQIAAFGRYLKLDMAIVTSIDHEHMEFFPNLLAVVDEELAVRTYSERLVINTDLCSSKYLAQINQPSVSFGFGERTDYRLEDLRAERHTYTFSLMHKGKHWLNASYHGVAKASAYSACAGAIVGHELGMTDNEIVRGIATITPVSGRMQVLRGIRGSIILDETYNSSPAAAKAALDVLYAQRAPQKIALLGNMNELGSHSPAAHTELGHYCDPAQLDLVLTLGPEANEYLAPAAAANDCQTKTFTTPTQAGIYLKSQIREGAVVLVKGSQNKVFAEEAIKPILADPSDASRLVRQSSAWLRKKSRSFK